MAIARFQTAGQKPVMQVSGLGMLILQEFPPEKGAEYTYPVVSIPEASLDKKGMALIG